MKGTRDTAAMTMKIARKKKRKGRETATKCDIMFMSNKTDMVVYKVKAVGYDKILVSKVEG